MSPKTMVLPALFVIGLFVNAIPAAAQAPKPKPEPLIFEPGKYHLAKMEFDGKTLEPKESLWPILYAPERDGLGEAFNGARFGLGEIEKADDKGAFHGRVAKCKSQIEVRRLLSYGDKRAFYANLYMNPRSENPIMFRMTGLVEYKDDMLIICFKADKDGDPLKQEMKFGTRPEDPELPPGITAKKGEMSIIYHYKRVR